MRRGDMPRANRPIFCCFARAVSGKLVMYRVEK
jgi:hypothetical protein